MPLRILVVDDDGHERRSLSLGLRVAGFQVAEASDASAAIALVEAQRFDVVIADLVMPGMSGIRLAALLQAKAPELPIVLTSGYELGRRQLDRAGVKLLAFVQKPYDIERLIGFLREKLPVQLAAS